MIVIIMTIFITVIIIIINILSHHYLWVKADDVSLDDHHQMMMGVEKLRVLAQQHLQPLYGGCVVGRVQLLLEIHIESTVGLGRDLEPVDIIINAIVIIIIIAIFLSIMHYQS